MLKIDKIEEGQGTYVVIGPKKVAYVAIPSISRKYEYTAASSNAPVLLELSANGKRTRPPEVPANNPVELVLEHTAVQTADIGRVGLAVRVGHCGRGG